MAVGTAPVWQLRVVVEAEVAERLAAPAELQMTVFQELRRHP